jgi:hypothetical protein
LFVVLTLSCDRLFSLLATLTFWLSILAIIIEVSYVTYTSNILSEERYLLKPLHHFISVLFCAVLWFICPNIFSSPIILTCKFLRHLTVSSFAALFGNRSGASLRFLFPFPYSQLVCLLISSSMSKKTTIESFTQDSPTKKRKITHLQKHIYSTPSSGNNDKKTHNKSSLLYDFVLYIFIPAMVDRPPVHHVARNIARKEMARVVKTGELRTKSPLKSKRCRSEPHPIHIARNIARATQGIPQKETERKNSTRKDARRKIKFN